MFWDLFRLKDWAVIGPVGVLALLLGFEGFLAMGHSVGDSVGDHTTLVVRVDPLDDRELARAEIACANSTMRVRLAWSGPARLAEIEQKIAGYPKLNAAVEGWTAI